jgi:hypothetical protein
LGAEIEVEGIEQGSWLSHFFAEQGDEVQTGRAVSVSSPFGQLSIGCAALCAKSLRHD